MRQLYKTIKIGGITIPIYWDDEEEGMQEGCLGYSEFCAENVEIALNPCLQNKPELLETTLYHEIFHQISAIFNLDFSEAMVSVLAVAMVDVLVSLNDEVVVETKKIRRPRKNKKSV